MFRWKMLSTEGFYRDLLAMTLAGAAAIVPCTMVATLLAASPALAAVACGMAGTLTLWVGLKFVRPELKTLPGATAALLSGATLGAVFPLSPVLGCVLFGGLFGVAQASAHERWSQKLALIGSTAAMTLLGGAVFGQVPQIAMMATGLPQPVVLTGMFGLFGFYMGLGALPAHVRVRRDLVGERYAQLAPGLHPEIKDTVFRTYALYNRFHRALPEGAALAEHQDEAFCRDLERLVMRIFALAERWQEIDAHLTGFRMGEVDQRMKQLDLQIAGCTDGQALVAYQKTRDALVQRGADCVQIQRARERIVSSLGYYFTKLEALHVMMVRLRCARSGEGAEEIEALLRDVGALGEEMDAAARSLEDVTGGALRLTA